MITHAERRKFLPILAAALALAALTACSGGGGPVSAETEPVTTRKTESPAKSTLPPMSAETPTETSEPKAAAEMPDPFSSGAEAEEDGGFSLSPV